MKKALIILTVAIVAAAVVALANLSLSERPTGSPQHTAGEQPRLFPTFENPGPEVPTVFTGALDLRGDPVSVSCSTCHSIREPNRQMKAAEQLAEFHRGLQYAHGGLSCLSCHNEENYDTLRLADGTPVDYANARMLCTQCHTRQGRDFERGLHGGMKGHWDLSRGPRQRNSCLDCHDPHKPAFPEMIPVFPPRDRFQPAEHHSHP
jgi:nitrate reductase cytochrome c-type subunit